MLRKNQILLIISLLIAAACTVNEPELPAWDTEWTIHLPTSNFIMQDVINDSTLLGAIDSEGNDIIKLNMSDSTERQSIEPKDFALDPEDDHFDATLGQISLGDPKELSTGDISILDIIPPEVLAFGDTLPPYDSTTVYPTPGTVEFDHFKSAAIESGFLYLTVQNNMFIEIREGLTIKIYDNSAANVLIDEITFTEAIREGEVVQSNTVDLAGKTISNKFRLEYKIPIAGSDTVQILTEERKNGSFQTSLTIAEIKVSWAEAKIPEQSFSQSDAIDVTNLEHHVKNALIDKGSCRIYLKNNLPLEADVELRLPNFRKNDQPKIVTQRLNCGQDYVEYIDLDGWEIIHHQQPGEMIDAIHYDVNSTVYESAGYVVISGDDSVSVDIQIDSLFFHSFEGVLDTISMEIEPTEFSEFDFFEDIEGQIRLNDLMMTLQIENEIDFSININLKVAGYRQDEITKEITDSVVVVIDEEIQRASISPVTTIILDENSHTPSVVDLLEIFPTIIKISGNIFIQGEGGISVGNGMRVLYTIESPLTFQINDPIIYNTPIDSLEKDDIDEETRDNITNDLTHISIQLDLTNGLPIGADIMFYIATDSTDLDSTANPDPSKKIVIEADVEPGIVDSKGFVTTPSENTVNINLSDEQMDIFQYYPLYTRQVFVIKQTDGPVRVRQSDEIEVDGIVTIKAIINNK